MLEAVAFPVKSRRRNYIRKGPNIIVNSWQCHRWTACVAVVHLPPCVTKHLCTVPRRKPLHTCPRREHTSLVAAAAALYISVQSEWLLSLCDEQTGWAFNVKVELLWADCLHTCKRSNWVNVTIFKLRPVGELDFLRSLCEVFLAKFPTFLYNSIISDLVILPAFHVQVAYTLSLYGRNTQSDLQARVRQVVYFYSCGAERRATEVQLPLILKQKY